MQNTILQYSALKSYLFDNSLMQNQYLIQQLHDSNQAKQWIILVSSTPQKYRSIFQAAEISFNKVMCISPAKQPDKIELINRLLSYQHASLIVYEDKLRELDLIKPSYHH